MFLSHRYHICHIKVAWTNFMISFLEHNGHGKYELLYVKKQKNNNDSSKYLYSTENLHHSLEQHESEYLT